MIDTKTLLERVSIIAELAGAAIMEIYAKQGDLGVKLKADESPLTIADQAANSLICEGLIKLDPSIPIISEENRAIPYEIRKNYDYYWLVDPLDGTKEFIKRNGEFTVNIALVHDQRPVLGVVYAPALRKLYTAATGAGAWLEQNGEKRQLQASRFTMQDSGLGVVCSRSHLNEATQAFIDRLHEPKTVASGSSLKFLILAEGKAHLYPRLGPTMEWDTGAAQIVLEEAGGQVIDEETKGPLRYNKENLLNPYFVAYGGVGS